MVLMYVASLSPPLINPLVLLEQAAVPAISLTNEPNVVVFPVVAIVMYLILLVKPLPLLILPPKIKPLVALEQDDTEGVGAERSPKSVALPVVAIVT